LDALPRAQGVVVNGPLRPHPVAHPEVRFVLEDARGVRWNTVYNLSTGALSGRRADAAHPGGLAELVESLHKQHHYPPQAVASWWWALFADLTAVTLLIWGFSGLIMWWQLKKLRKIGIAVILLAVVVATLVMGGTLSELAFAPDAAEGG
jgi:hypothetical protein